MDDAPFLNPDEARTRFGRLTQAAGRTETHVYFHDPQGEWRPAFDAHVRLIGYRLFRDSSAVRKYVFRPDRRRWPAPFDASRTV